ncbi:MAG: mevalonate kinase [Polyangiaceae bacterium]|nr:mevalonate kinase [Polyangiaceae bacterium]
MTVAHALGKVILFGEHAVVYGVPAIAAGIALGTEAYAERSKVSSLELGELVASSDDDSELARAFSALLAKLDAGSFSVKAKTALPPGCGLGASASLGVAIARAVLECAHPGTAEDPERVLGAADAWERVFHANPSGIDAMAAMRGGCFRFTRNMAPTPIKLAHSLCLAIAVAGPPAPTAEMVNSVAQLKERRPEVVERTLEGIRSLVQNAELCLKTGDLAGVGKLMDYNQMLLSGLFVSTQEIEEACWCARQAGALGAKLTGAGGGGSVIALVEKDPDPVLKAWQQAGFRAFSSIIG